VNGGLQTAQLVAKGQFRPTIDFYVNGEFETKPFDFGHLVDPVPASIYYDAHDQDCWAEQTHCATITDNSYRPRIRLAKRIWQSILPNGLECEDPMVVDPPIALYPISMGSEQLGLMVPTLTPDSENGFKSHADQTSPTPAQSAHPSYPAETEKSSKRSGAGSIWEEQKTNGARALRAIVFLLTAFLPYLLCM
jgi:hypothetical protein